MRDLATSPIGQLSDLYVDTLVGLNPNLATSLGIPGHEDELTDWSPSALDARTDLARRTLAALDELDVEGPDETLAVAQMASELSLGIEFSDSGEPLRDLNVLFSPLQQTRKVFDQMPSTSVEDWEHLAARMVQVPDALVSARLALEAGRSRGLVAARRQALACAEQCDTFAGADGPERAFFLALARRAPDVVPAPLRDRVVAAATAATSAYGELGRWLRDDYARAADPVDGVGRERYELFAARFVGGAIDLDDTYAWGWEELAELTAETERVAAAIAPGESVQAVQHLLETDPERAIEGVDAFQTWLQGLQDQAIASLHGEVFDIPEAIRRVEVMIAPAGSAAAPYYTPPSVDLSRPGRTWYPVEGRSTFPTWGEVSTAYHEGVPGHHLQLASMRLRADALTRYQSLLGGSSGNSEGWALYAERLMDELGHLERPEHRMGMLRLQSFRAARVVIDIGLHLGLSIPADLPANVAMEPGAPWSAERARDFLRHHGGWDDHTVTSEVDRYLGLPGQAICYKVGERVFRTGRQRAEALAGSSFDLKTWHTAVLRLGRIGLDLLRPELDRIANEAVA